MELIVEIFSFVLTKIAKDDVQVLKDEVESLKRMSRELKSEISLFNYQFFGTASWSD